uniref:Uncharacterized protein n=1 Tax=Aromatoleum anaerobium TaxID=182180 RepID=A0ABX1PIL5_9RHOO
MTLGESLLAEAKSLNINISQAAEAGVSPPASKAALHLPTNTSSSLRALSICSAHHSSCSTGAFPRRSATSVGSGPKPRVSRRLRTLRVPSVRPW